MGLRTRIAVTREIECLRLTKVSVHLQGTRVHFAQTVRINRPPCPVPIRSKCVNHRFSPNALILARGDVGSILMRYSPHRSFSCKNRLEVAHDGSLSHSNWC